MILKLCSKVQWLLSFWPFNKFEKKQCSFLLRIKFATKWAPDEPCKLKKKKTVDQEIGVKKMRDIKLGMVEISKNVGSNNYTKDTKNSTGRF